MKKHIGIITYDKPHLKTQEVFFNLVNKYKITFFTVPFRKFSKKKTLYKHRPYQFIGYSAEKLARKFKIEIHKIENLKKFKNIDYFLICGAGIIPNKYIIKNKMINCHSGIIPNSRGLDSLKWSVFNSKIVGVTLHFIDKNIDLGKTIHQIITPISLSESFKEFAKKHYDYEIFLLSNFEFFLNSKKIMKIKQEKPTLRIPLSKEKKLKFKFEKYKVKFLQLIKKIKYK